MPFTPIPRFLNGGQVATAPPRSTTIEFANIVRRADPGIRTRPDPQYEFSNGRIFYDRSVDPNSLDGT